ncbi:hypothetical protein D1BOALGB6SA_1056 [Olavius sp. associated proteobacterium Delta 1]|nr:hypothetical protein D1BOALGB6SA_1056 [Olavius sp. associated proteobacterium Delta 1]
MLSAINNLIALSSNRPIFRSNNQAILDALILFWYKLNILIF